MQPLHLHFKQDIIYCTFLVRSVEVPSMVQGKSWVDRLKKKLVNSSTVC